MAESQRQGRAALQATQHALGVDVARLERQWQARTADAARNWASLCTLSESHEIQTGTLRGCQDDLMASNGAVARLSAELATEQAARKVCVRARPPPPRGFQCWIGLLTAHASRRTH